MSDFWKQVKCFFMGHTHPWFRCFHCGIRPRMNYSRDEFGDTIFNKNGSPKIIYKGNRFVFMRKRNGLVKGNGRKCWYKNDRIHREDGPAIIDAKGNKFWYKNDKLHREDGPAIEKINGDREWFIDGKWHREDGPAVIESDGMKKWFRNGELHREDGPSIEFSDGDRYWYFNGERVNCSSNEEFLRLIKLKAFW